MSADPEAPAIEPDTPTPDAVSDPTPAVDYQKRYEDLRPEFDRTRQTLSDEDKLLQHIQEKFPHLIAADEDDEDYDEPAPAPGQDQPVTDPRVEEVASRLERIEAERAAAQFEKDFTEALGDRKLPKKGREWIEYQTFTNGNDAEALKAAVDAWFEDDELHPAPAPPERPRAPHVPSGGPPSDPPPASTHNDRVQRALERIQAEQA